jgi:lipopolysaccharide biosynthesis protein
MSAQPLPLHRVEALRSIAFYLPQFHPIRENDDWWGAGFTEWRNVVKAQPRFRGHYQPHLPGELGFYDLRLPEVREQQAELARSHRIDGFCYYHYWFNGRRLLERPFEEVLRLGTPTLPFALCWANEDWTRKWDGKRGVGLIRQTYDIADDRAHIRSLLQAFADPRYIRIDGRPLFLVYRASLLPSPRQTTEVWREEASKAGIGDLFLCRVEGAKRERTDPRALGFDGSVDFQPELFQTYRAARTALRGAARKVGLVRTDDARDTIRSYERSMRHMLSKREPEYRRFPCVMPGWDNSARRVRGATIFRGSSPEIYGQWLAEVARREVARHPEDAIVFVNAWNEWAEGAHLEPCERFGRGYLEAHRGAVETVRSELEPNRLATRPW